MKTYVIGNEEIDLDLFDRSTLYDPKKEKATAPYVLPYIGSGQEAYVYALRGGVLKIFKQDRKNLLMIKENRFQSFTKIKAKMHNFPHVLVYEKIPYVNRKLFCGYTDDYSGAVSSFQLRSLLLDSLLKQIQMAEEDHQLFKQEKLELNDIYPRNVVLNDELLMHFIDCGLYKLASAGDHMVSNIERHNNKQLIHFLKNVLFYTNPKTLHCDYFPLPSKYQTLNNGDKLFSDVLLEEKKRTGAHTLMELRKIYIYESKQRFLSKRP